MGVPKKRRSIMKKRMRRAHHALTRLSLSKCPNCGEPALPHRVCSHCNMYKGKKVLDLED